MRRRTGTGIVDTVIAFGVVAMGLIPVMGSLESDLATVKPRESDLAVSNLARGCLERLAAPRHGADALQDLLAAGYRVAGQDVMTLARLVQSDCAGLADLAQTSALSLAIERRQRLCPPATDPKRFRASLDVWVVRARWTEAGSPKSRLFFRVAAQG